MYLYDVFMGAARDHTRVVERYLERFDPSSVDWEDDLMSIVASARAVKDARDALIKELWC